MTIKIDYPIKLSFNTEEELPDFVYACPVRTKILRKWLEGQSGGALDYHVVDDFVVEVVTKTKDGEKWLVGS